MPTIEFGSLDKDFVNFFLETDKVCDKSAHLFPIEKRKIAIITDSNVAKLFGKDLHKKLKDAGVDSHLAIFEAGEHNKTRDTKQYLEDFLLSNNFAKDSCIIGLGGGVVLDLAGFVAATYYRGIKLIFIPTTLLAMVDACLGGKVAVNTDFGKNLIGTFYSASLIFIDQDFLKTLPQREILCGYAEIIKHGLVASPKILSLLSTSTLGLIRSKSEAFARICSSFPSRIAPSTILFEESCPNSSQISLDSEGRNPKLRLSENNLESLIKENLKIKQKIITEDFYETGKRRILNFGHTLGHALEFASNFALNHGEAIAKGLAFESFLSFKLGYLKESSFLKITDILKNFGFDLKIDFTFEELEPFLQKDKKAIENTVRFVLLRDIGRACKFGGDFCINVDSSLLRECYEQFNS